MRRVSRRAGQLRLWLSVMTFDKRGRDMIMVGMMVERRPSDGDGDGVGVVVMFMVMMMLGWAALACP